MVAIVSFTFLFSFPTLSCWGESQPYCLFLACSRYSAPKAATPFFERESFERKEEYFLLGRNQAGLSVSGQGREQWNNYFRFIGWRKFDSYSLSNFSVRCLDRYFQIFRNAEAWHCLLFECIQSIHPKEVMYGCQPSKRNMWHARISCSSSGESKVEKVKKKKWNSHREQLKREWKEKEFSGRETAKWELRRILDMNKGFL